MDNRILLKFRNKEKSETEKQADFYNSLIEAPRKKAKDLLIKQTDKAIEAIVELKADIVTNGITTKLFDCKFNDTDTFFEPLNDSIGYMNFLIDKEVNRLLDISVFKEPSEKDKDKERKERFDKKYNEKVKEIRNKNGTITLDY